MPSLNLLCDAPSAAPQYSDRTDKHEVVDNSSNKVETAT